MQKVIILFMLGGFSFFSKGETPGGSLPELSRSLPELSLVLGSKISQYKSGGCSYVAGLCGAV